MQRCRRLRHIERVWKAIYCCQRKQTCLLLPCSIITRYSDSKFNNGDEEIGPAKAKQFLQSINVENAAIDHEKIIAMFPSKDKILQLLF